MSALGCVRFAWGLGLRFDTDPRRGFVHSGLVSVPVLLSAVDEVGQGHLLVAGQLVPLSRRGEKVEVERGSEEVSNKLESHGLVHGERFLKLNIEWLSL
jgi:hypothetical protein